jgi:putative membrane protein
VICWPPLDVSVAYKLDGEPVEPGDIVGESGELEVAYTVKNITGQPQEVSFPDGSGGTTTETVDVPIPMVGSLTTVAPESFSNVASDQANMAGDGKGGTKLSFTMTLFPPIGSDTAEFGYTADIVDGVVPRADVSALPVNPLESPTFAAAADSYQGGTDTGAKLAEGAATIDSNLLKLRDGASELLAGLIKLRDGSAQLQDGLADEAAPGAAKLADGAGQLDDGLGRIADGANRLFDGMGQAAEGGDRLADGAQRLSEGLSTAEGRAPKLVDGLKQLRGGLVLVDQGLKKLYVRIGSVPAKAQPLHDGIATMVAGIGSEGQPGTLLYGVDQVREGLTAALPKIDTMASGVYNIPSASNTEPGAYQKLGCALTVLAAVKDGTLGEGALQAGGTDPCFRSVNNPNGTIPPMSALTGFSGASVSSVIGGLNDGRSKLAKEDPTTGAVVVDETTLYGGLRTLHGRLAHVPDPMNPQDAPGAILALAAIQCGLDNDSLGDEGATPIPLEAVCARYPAGHELAGQKKPGLLQGLGQMDAGIDTLTATVVQVVRDGVGTAADTPNDETLRGGMQGLLGGADKLSAGGDDLLHGLGLLSDGAGQLDDGSIELSDGLERLNDGAGKLADGTAEAADGSGKLSDGAGKLADGLKDAADGSGRLTDGLGQASDGAPKLVAGAQELSDKGTSKLVEAGKDTTQTYGQMYATMQAGAERAQVEDMAYGAPEGAAGLTAYSYVIQGEDGEAGRNWARGLAGMALLGLGGGGFLLRRRLI